MHDFLTGTAYTLLYYIILASSALILRFLIKIPDEIFRKTLHCILLGSLLVYVFGFEYWHTSVLSCVIFAAVVFPILWFFERFRAYSAAVTERNKGELKISLLVVFSMFAVVITVCRGLLGDSMLVLASVYAWGLGDAAAALIGKKYGKHKLPDGKKSWEGSAAMFAVSFVSVFVILMFRSGMPFYGYVITALVTALASAVVEYLTPGGFDTITCPFAAMTALIPLTALFGGLV